jgi:hypothetical protein
MVICVTTSSEDGVERPDYSAGMTAAFIGLTGALAGTIVGAFLTQALQRRNAAYARVHEARVEAYRAFALAAMEYRRALMDRWFVQNEGRPKSETENVYVKRSAVWTAYFQVELVAGDPAIAARAADARDITTLVKNATTREEVETAGEASREAVGRFVNLAKAEVTPQQGRGVVSTRA